MEHAVQHVVHDRHQSLVDVRHLAAGVAKFALQRRLAIEAIAVRVRAVRHGFAGFGLQRAPDQGAGGEIACCFESPLHRGSVTTHRFKRDCLLCSRVGGWLAP